MRHSPAKEPPDNSQDLPEKTGRRLVAIGRSAQLIAAAQTLLLIDTPRITAFPGSTAYFEKVAGVNGSAYGGPKGRGAIKRAFLGGEPDDWIGKRARIEAEHGIKTHGAYGTADLGLVGYEVEGIAIPLPSGPAGPNLRSNQRQAVACR